MKKERYEVILAGSGGQGRVVSGFMRPKRHSGGQNMSFRPSPTAFAYPGWFSMAGLIIDRDEIIFQEVQNADIVLALTEEAMERFQSLTGRGTEILYDTTLLKARQGDHLSGHPFTEMASRLGHVGMANIIALGCMAKQYGMVETQSLAAVIGKRFSGKTLALNLEALAAGIALVTS
jgi:2-oxoglutarate ferredoxin oxidoreductase subunit gamma